MPYTYDYPRPALTADAVVFTILQHRLHVLLIQRMHEPFASCWALPGGFVEERERAADAVVRELEEETGLRDVWFEQLKTFDAPDRDPRGWTVSVAYVALIAGDRVQLASASDASDARWWPVDSLPTLAFDHAEIVAYARQRLRTELRWSDLGSQLLPSMFTMDELRLVHEVVLNDVLDKHNFQKRVLESGTIRAAGTVQTSGKRGPQARLYAFVPRQKA